MSEESVAPDLGEKEQAKAESRTALRPHVVYEAIRREGEIELERPASALAWSGLAAGLSMGFCLVCEGLLRAHLPVAPWASLVARLGYSVGFLIVILARQQLFTENTLTVILPALAHPGLRTFLAVTRLWAIVLATNLLGTFLFAEALAHGHVFNDHIMVAFSDIASKAVEPSWTETFVRAIFSGWLIALMVWMMPAAESSRVFVIILITYIVGLGGLSHTVAGAVEAFYTFAVGDNGLVKVLGGFLLPTLLGNVIGGVSLVSALNHAQVVSDKTRPETAEDNNSKIEIHSS